MLFKTIKPSSRFGGAPNATSVLQCNIGLSENDADKYVVSFVKDVFGSSGIDYFEVPDIEGNGIWCNGLDDKSLASECIKLHDTYELAMDSLHSNGNRYVNYGYSISRIYKSI